MAFITLLPAPAAFAALPVVAQLPALALVLPLFPSIFDFLFYGYDAFYDAENQKARQHVPYRSNPEYDKPFRRAFALKEQKPAETRHDDDAYNQYRKYRQYNRQYIQHFF
jgi:hypothetical protein